MTAPVRRFVLPSKYPPAPVLIKCVRQRRLRAKDIKNKKNVAYKSIKAMPTTKTTSLLAHKKKFKPLRYQDPESIALKADRLRFIDEIEEYRNNLP